MRKSVLTRNSPSQQVSASGEAAIFRGAQRSIVYMEDMLYEIERVRRFTGISLNIDSIHFHRWYGMGQQWTVHKVTTSLNSAELIQNSD